MWLWKSMTKQLFKTRTKRPSSDHCIQISIWSGKMHAEKQTDPNDDIESVQMCKRYPLIPIGLSYVSDLPGVWGNNDCPKCWMWHPHFLLPSCKNACVDEMEHAHAIYRTTTSHWIWQKDAHVNADMWTRGVGNDQHKLLQHTIFITPSPAT